MGSIRSTISFAIEAAIALLAHEDRLADDCGAEECPEDDAFYDPNGTAHAHFLDTRGIPMDQDWLHGKH